MADIGGIDVGRFGIFTFNFERLSAAQIRESIQELEEQGWPAFWLPDAPLGREAMTHAGLLLASTQDIVVINAIARISPRRPEATFSASLLLADAYPDRHVLGLGLGEPQPNTTPLRAINEYLDAMDAVEGPNPRPRTPLRRILGAHGPKMRALARDRADGVITAKVNIEHTAQTREILGPDAFLGVEHAIVLEADPTQARTVAREHLDLYLNAQYNVAKFRELGYSDEDLSDGGSDRFVDDFVYWGDIDEIVTKLNGHLEAGADHVAVQVIGTESSEQALAQWGLLRKALPEPV